MKANKLEKTAKMLIRNYRDNRRTVAGMHKYRPGLVERAGISIEGYIPWDYSPEGVKMPRRDKKVLCDYYRSRRQMETVDIAIDGRLNGRDQELVSDTVRECLSVPELMEKYGISSATVTRVRRKGIEAVMDEIELQGLSSDYFSND